MVRVSEFRRKPVVPGHKRHPNDLKQVAKAHRLTKAGYGPPQSNVFRTAEKVRIDRGF